MKFLQKIIPTSIAIFMSISCNQKQKVNNESKLKIEEVPKSTKPLKKNYNPIFLDLSPAMSDVEFDRQIRNLNEKGSLEGNIFSLKVNDKFEEFEVSKTINSIRLTLEESETYGSNEINRQLSGEILEKYDNKKNQILKIFINKYKKNDFQFPKNIDLSNYNFNKENYKILKNAEKYVIIGYSINGGIFPSIDEQRQEDEETGRLKQFGVKAASRRPELIPHGYKFGIEFQIDYFEKFEIEKIIEKIEQESNNQDEILKKSKEIQKSKEKAKERNISEI